MTIKNRLPLALSYDSNDNPSGLAEYSISSVDLVDVATDHAPEHYQVLAWSAVGDGSFIYAPSTITAGTGGGGGGSFTCGDLTGCSVTALTDVCGDAASEGEVLAWDGSQFCPSTLVIIDPNSTLPVTANPKLTFTQAPQFNAGLQTTGSVTFAAAPTVGGSEDPLVVTSELDPFLTTALAEDQFLTTALAEDQFLTTALAEDQFLTTALAEEQYLTTALAEDQFLATALAEEQYLTTALAEEQYLTTSLAEEQFVLTSVTSTLLEKPGSGGNNDLILYASNNETSTQTPGNFISTNEIAKYTAANVFTQTNSFENGLNVTGPTNVTGSVTFKDKPKVDGTDVVIATDLNAYATNTKVDNLAVTSLIDVALQDAGSSETFNVVLRGNILTTSSFGGNDSGFTNTVTVPPGKTGIGDIVADTILFFSGTDASSTDSLSLSIDGKNLIQNGSATNVSAENIIATTQVSSPLIKGDGGLFTTISNVETLTGADLGLTITTETTANISVSTPSLSATDLSITRTGQGNPACYIHEADWLTAGTAANGFGQSNTGTGAGTGQCFDNDVMHPDKGTIGVIEVRSGTDAYGRCFVTTFNNAIAVSSGEFSFTSRMAPSGLWVTGENEGRMCFGFRNGTSNAEATYAMEFQYGQGAGGGGDTWSAVVTDNSNSTVTDTGVAASGQEFQVLQVSCNENWDTVDFYIDGVNKAQFTLAAGHTIPDNRFNRLGLAWAIRNANSWGSSVQDVGNEIFIDWHQYRFKPNTSIDDPLRGRDLIQ